MNKPTLLSIIITTYNRPDALKLVLLALNDQSEQTFEVIIADDGSTQETRQLIDAVRHQLSFPIYLVWHEDKGFRAGMIRNKAAAKASGDYLIFLDGDCIPSHYFIARHAKLAEPSTFVTGNRVLLSEGFTNRVLEQTIPIHSWSLYHWLIAKLKKQSNRILPTLSVPLGSLRKMQPRKWQGAKTCNLAMWKKDFVNVNGFDEQYTGWGYEDSDLVIRLMRQSVYRKEGRFAVPVFHLWHIENDRTHEKENLHRLESLSKTKQVVINKGINQYEHI